MLQILSFPDPQVSALFHRTPPASNCAKLQRMNCLTAENHTLEYVKGSTEGGVLCCTKCRSKPSNSHISNRWGTFVHLQITVELPWSCPQVLRLCVHPARAAQPAGGAHMTSTFEWGRGSGWKVWGELEGLGSDGQSVFRCFGRRFKGLGAEVWSPDIYDRPTIHDPWTLWEQIM